MSKQLTMEEIADLENFDPATVPNEPSPRAMEIMNLLSEKTFIIEKYLPIHKYDEFIDTLLESMTEGFEFEEFRNHPVMFKFYEEDDGSDVKSLPFRAFIVNVILWRCMMCIDPSNLTDELIVTPAEFTRINKSFIKDYFDMHYMYPYRNHIPAMPDLVAGDMNYYMNEFLCDATHQLNKISNIFNKFIGISSSIETFIDLEKRIPEIKDCMEFEIDERMQPSEIEHVMAEKHKTLINAIINDDHPNMMKALVQPGSGMKQDQFRDMVIDIALKPDENGKTIPHPIGTNYLNKGGLQHVDQYLVNSTTGRKAAIINYEYMGKTGYLQILIAINTSSMVLSKTTMDCNTVNPIPIDIKSEVYLNKLHGRRYRFPGERKYHILNKFKDKNLIGETLYFRSPATCACKDGVCRECYGDLYYTNIGLNNQGIFSATIVMNPVTQGILSAKHHQTTNSSVIKFNEEFDKFFQLSGTDIVLADTIDDIESYSIVIRKGDILTVDGEEAELDNTKKKRRKKKADALTKAAMSVSNDEFGIDDDLDDDGDAESLGLTYYTNRFQVVKYLNSKNDSIKEYITLEDIDSKDLYMHNDFVSKLIPGTDDDGDYYSIDLDSINPEEFIFLVEVENNELTRPMKKIKKVLNNKDHEGCATYEELVNKMLDLMVASKLSADSVHGEMIIAPLIRSASNVLKRPNFSKIIMTQDYQLMTILGSLKKNPSVTTSISTSYLKAQLVDITETFQKRNSGVFDPLFAMTLSQDVNRVGKEIDQKHLDTIDKYVDKY